MALWRHDAHFAPAPRPIRRWRGETGSGSRQLGRESVDIVRGEEAEIAVVTEFADPEGFRAATEVKAHLASE